MVAPETRYLERERVAKVSLCTGEETNCVMCELPVKISHEAVVQNVD